MKNREYEQLWETFGGGALMIICGAVLMLFPDLAVSILIRVIAWVLVATGVIQLISLVSGGRRGGKWIWTLLYLAVGGYLLSHPMALTDTLGRFFGLFLLIQGLGDLRRSITSRGRSLGAVTALAGLILSLLPRLLTDALLGIGGIVLVILGVINVVGKMDDRKHLHTGDPNIIDADE